MTEQNEEKSLSEMLGMTFKEDGSLDKIKDVGKSNIFRKLNRKERRYQKAIEKRAAKKGK